MVKNDWKKKAQRTKFTDKLKCSPIGQPRQKERKKKDQKPEDLKKKIFKQNAYGNFVVQLDRSIDASTLGLVYGTGWILSEKRKKVTMKIFCTMRMFDIYLVVNCFS